MDRAAQTSVGVTFSPDRESPVNREGQALPQGPSAPGRAELPGGPRRAFDTQQTFLSVSTADSFLLQRRLYFFGWGKWLLLFCSCISEDTRLGAPREVRETP